MVDAKMIDSKYDFRFQDIMNREKESQLPLMQVNFIDSICLPVYEVSIHTSLASHQF